MKTEYLGRIRLSLAIAVVLTLAGCSGSGERSNSRSIEASEHIASNVAAVTLPSMLLVCPVLPQAMSLYLVATSILCAFTKSPMGLF
jgi:hypothetical protein